jgi:manganese/iron transport system permease protein
MLNFLLDPLHYEFIRQALLMGLVIGAIGPVMGSYLLVQRMALLGDVIAHGVLPGLAVAHFLGIPIVVGAFGSGMLTTFLIAWIRSQSRVKADAAMALTFASFFALGVCLITKLKRRVDLDALLFGDILSVQPLEILQALGVGVGIILLVMVFYRPLLFYTFDRVGAKAIGLPTGWLHYGLMALVTLTILLGVRSVGVILIISLMVGPAMTAFLWVKTLHWMMLLGSLLGAMASTIGILLSYYWDLPSGPAIALVVFAQFLLTLLFAPKDGVMVRGLRRIAGRNA